jgi:hypothetical protein
MFRDQLYVNPGPIPARQRDRKSSPGVTLTIRATSFCISIEGGGEVLCLERRSLISGPHYGLLATNGEGGVECFRWVSGGYGFEYLGRN